MDSQPTQTEFNPDGLGALMPIAKRPPLLFERGEGSWLWDSEGRRYLDFIQGWAVNCLGHCAAPVVDALQRQASTLINPSPALYNRPMLELAGRLSELSGMDEVFFTNSGAEANEGAIKLARKWGTLQRDGAWQIITMENGFHGRTLATMSASGKPGWDTLFEPKVPGFIKVPFNDLQAVAGAIRSETVAIMLEPVQGEAGVIPATREFIAGLRQLADENGILLILDEVQTGVGRLGTLFASDYYGVRPDIMTLGKGLGGGVPIAALLASHRVSCFEPGDQGGTYNGNPLMCAVAAAVLETVAAPGFLATVRERGEVLRQGLEGLSQRYGMGEVRGAGMLLALNTGGRDANAIVAAALEAGLLINAPRPNTLRFMPALNVSLQELEQMLATLSVILAEME